MNHSREGPPTGKPPAGLNALTAAALGALMRRLAADPESAAKEYETIRRKLALFFGMRCCAGPDHLADETIDRVARRLEEGVPVANLSAYVYGVAKRVLLESERRGTRERAALETRRRLSAYDEHDELREARIACLKRCLFTLPEDSRSLILDYYEAGRGPSEEARKALAERLGLTYGTLKVRAHRIRGRLEACLAECLSGRGVGRRDER